MNKYQRKSKWGLARISSIRSQLILAMSLLLLVILCAVYVVFDRYYVTEYQNNHFFFNQISMTTVQQAAEQWYFEKEKMAHELFQMEDMNRLVAAGDLYQQEQLSAVAVLLQQKTESDLWVSQMELVIRESELVVRSDCQMFSWEEYQETHCMPEQLDWEAPESQLIVEGDDLILCYAYPQERPLAMLVVTISKEELYNTLSGKWKAESAWPLLIYDQNQQAVFQEQMKYPEFGNLDLILKAAGEEYCCYALAENPDLLVMKVYSSILGWHLISYMEEAGILPIGSRIFQTIFPCLLIILLVIVGISILLLRNIYRPIQGVVNYIDSNTNREELVAGNELEYIRDSVEREIKEKESLRQMVGAASQKIEEQLLVSLISSPSSDCDEIIEGLRQLQSICMDSCRCVLLVYGCWELEERGRVQEEYHMYKAQSLVNCFWEKVCTVRSLNLGRQMQGLLLVYPADVTAAHIRRLFKQFEEEMEQTLTTSEYRLVWGISSIVNDCRELARGYEEAKKKLYRSIYYEEKKLETDSADVVSDALFFRNTFTNMMDQIIGGERGKDLALQEWGKELVRSQGQSLGLIYPELFECGLEKLIELHADTRGILSEYHPSKISEDMLSVKLEAYIESICQLLMYSRYKEQFRYVEGAKRFIQENYTNSMLSLDMVSASLGISSAYLSTLFTRFLAIGFVEYLNRYRIDQAKQLLEMTKIPIAEIGLKTGFNSTQNFGRVFKKYEGKTPSQYRELIQKD